MFILEGHRQPVQAVAFSPDGSALLSVDRSDAIRVWDVPSGKLRWEADDAFYMSVTITPDSRYVLICDKRGGGSNFDREHPIQLRDIVTGTLSSASLIPPTSEGVFELTFSPAGDRCVGRPGFSSLDLAWWDYPAGGAARLWRGVAPTPLSYWALVFSPDGRRLAAMNLDGVAVFDVGSGARQVLHPCKAMQDHGRLAFHPDGRRLAVASGTRAVILDLNTGREVAEMTQPKRKNFLALAFTPDGRHLLTASFERTVKVWDPASGRLVTEYAWQVGGLRCLAMSPDGLLAAVGGLRRKVVVWDLDG